MQTDQSIIDSGVLTISSNGQEITGERARIISKELCKINRSIYAHAIRAKLLG